MMRLAGFTILSMLGSGALVSPSLGQQSTQAPIYGHVQDFSKQILDEMRAASERADADVRQASFYQAAREYEGEIDRWGSTPELLLTYPVLMALAGAHLEAAFDRVMNAAKDQDLLNNLSLRDQNRDAVNNHIELVYIYVAHAANLAGAVGLSGDGKTDFVCTALEKMAAARSLLGIVNSSSEFLDQGIAGYEKTKACTPAAGKAILYLTAVRANMTHSVISPDNIAKTVSELVKETVRGGTFISLFLDAGYDYYKDHQPPVASVLPR